MAIVEFNTDLIRLVIDSYERDADTYKTQCDRLVYPLTIPHIMDVVVLYNLIISNILR